MTAYILLSCLCAYGCLTGLCKLGEWRMRQIGRK